MKVSRIGRTLGAHMTVQGTHVGLDIYLAEATARHMCFGGCESLSNAEVMDILDLTYRNVAKVKK